MPMLPDSSSLHIDGPLTGVSVAYFQSNKNFIADKVFPSVPVDKKSDVFWKFSKSDWRRSNAQKRAPGTETVGIGWGQSTDNYVCDVYGAHVDIDAQTRANADSNWNLDALASRRVTQDLLLQKDILWADTYFSSGVWSNQKTGVASAPSTNQFVQWDQSGSDPLGDVTAWSLDFKLSVGEDPTFMVLGPDVWKALKNHAEILDRIKYTQRGVVTLELVASFFDIPKLMVAMASKSTGPALNDTVEQDAQATYEWVADPKGILFGFAPTAAAKETPSAGYTFNWRGYGAGNGAGLTMSSFYKPETKSDRIEGEAAYVMKKVSDDCGVFCENAVS